MASGFNCFAISLAPALPGPGIFSQLLVQLQCSLLPAPFFGFFPLLPAPGSLHMTFALSGLSVKASASPGSLGISLPTPIAPASLGARVTCHHTHTFTAHSKTACNLGEWPGSAPEPQFQEGVCSQDPCALGTSLSGQHTLQPPFPPRHLAP